MKPAVRLALYILLILSVLLAIVFWLLRDKTDPLISMVDFSSKWSFNFYDSKLKKIVDGNLRGKEGEYAVVIERLEDERNEGYYYNERKSFPAGSFYKLFLLAAVFELIERGELTEDGLISSSKSHLEEVLGGEEFGYKDFEGDEITYKVKEAVQRVGTISDNFAAIMLAEKISWDRVRNVVKTIGAENTDIHNPISTTADDIALFFRKLYRKEVISPEVSDKLINLLSGARINDRIPAKLPKSLKIAHKTAELSRIRSDAGIVFLEGKPYLIVLMSKDLRYEDDGVALLAKISREVYEYFTKDDL